MSTIAFIVIFALTAALVIVKVHRETRPRLHGRGRKYQPPSSRGHYNCRTVLYEAPLDPQTLKPIEFKDCSGTKGVKPDPALTEISLRFAREANMAYLKARYGPDPEAQILRELDALFAEDDRTKPIAFKFAIDDRASPVLQKAADECKSLRFQQEYLGKFPDEVDGLDYGTRALDKTDPYLKWWKGETK